MPKKFRNEGKKKVNPEKRTVRIGNRKSGSSASTMSVDDLKAVVSSGRPRDQQKARNELQRRGVLLLEKQDEDEKR